MKRFFLIFSTMILCVFYASSFAAEAVATFAGGCFWTMQYDFDKVPGVIKTTVGYTGGNVANPTYGQVSTGGTGHREAIQVVYDPGKISYPQLLDFYWHNIDPVNTRGQFCDMGDEYRTAIFYHDPSQQQQAEASKQQLLANGKFAQIATEIRPAQTFYPAEYEHQFFYQKNPTHFNAYEFFCGRERALEKIWGK